MQFVAPKSVEEAVGILAAEAGLTRIVAGGTDLVVQMGSGRISPALVMDVQRIPALRTITAEAGGVRIGAGASLQDSWDR